MQQIIGYRKNDFQNSEKKQITGYNVYISTEIDPRYGSGVSVERIYLTDAKISRDGIDLPALLGKSVRVYFNRYGRPDSIVAI